MTAFPPQSILGIDIAKAKADTQFQRVGSAEKPLHRIYDNTPAGHEQVVTWLATHHVGQLHVCLEATGTYGDALALRLHQAGYRVSIVNPLRIKRYGESELLRIKSDKTDAAATGAPPLARPGGVCRPVSASHPLMPRCAKPCTSRR